MEHSSINPHPADHLCVLVHGLWGNPQHLAYLASELRARFPTELHVLVTKTNTGSFTYDGIETGAERVTKEIEETLELLAREGRTIRKISIVGYSLGGLIARYAVGLLDSKGWFDRLEPVNFTTFASPHLGVRTPLLGYHNHLWNVMGARMLSMSGRQLFTIDNFRDTGRPLLAVLADPGSIFIRALEKFKHRSLYTNIVNDRSAVYYTTGISRIDPFVELNDIKLNYLEGYEPIILDPAAPVSAKDDEELPSFYKRLAGGSRTVVQAAPVVLILAVIVPIVVTGFSISSVFQSFRSRQRIRMHEEGKAGIDVGPYRVPLVLDGVRRTAEDLFENVGHRQGQDYLPTGSEEMAGTDADGRPVSPTVTRSDAMAAQEKAAAAEAEADAESASSSDSDAAAAAKKTLSSHPTPTALSSRAPEFPTLALTADQFAMISALDDVGFKKYPVHIHKVRHSHAAIVVRSNWNRFSEGRVVVRHWLDQYVI